MKEFEEYFSEIQADMISICLEYANNRADKVEALKDKDGNVIEVPKCVDKNGILSR